MNEIDSILRKVQSLLNVEGRTPEEAAAYVEKAHAILAQYDLTMESVANLSADKRTAIRKSDVVGQTTEGKPDGWKSDLLVAVAEAFECHVMWSYHYEETKGGRERRVKEGRLIGFGHDVEAAGYAQAFLVGEVTRLAKAYARVGWDAIKALRDDRGISLHDAEAWYVQQGHPHPLKSELYFIKGATQTVTETLVFEARMRKMQAAEANPNALVVQKGDAVRDYIYQERYGKTYAEKRAEWDAQAAKWVEEAKANPAAVAKPESPSARRRREEAEERRQRKAEDASWRRYVREQNATDHSALRAGQEAGRTIKVRPGIGGTTAEGGHLG